MTRMYDKLPHCVYLKNERFIINADYRIFIDFEEEILQGMDIKEVTKKTLSKFYPAFLEICRKNLLNEAIDKFVWFYQCGKKDIETNETKSNNDVKRSQVYSYYHDDMLIWGTYKQYFDIDLSKENVHWWVFKSLWKVIPGSAEYSKIRGYRAYTGKDKEMLDLKEYYKLPPTKAELEDKIRQDKLFEALK